MSSTIKKIIVFGAHGKVGQQLIAEASKSSSDYHVTAVIRNQSQADQIAKVSNNNSNFTTKELTIDTANVKELSKAISGHDAVVFTAGSAGKDLLKVDLDGAVKTFEATVDADVRRYILISAIHADNRESFNNLPLRNYYISKHYADRILSNEFKHSLDFTILKPTALTDDKPTGKIKIVKSIDEPIGSVTRTDVAKVILEVLDKPTTYGKSYDFKNGDSDINTPSIFD